MYQHHFGLNELPFSIAPDPRYLYMSERHREAMAHLLFGMQSSGAFILLTGEVGTGKTTVSRCLLERIPPHTRLAMVLNPMMSALELLQSVCDELHIAHPADASIKAYVDALNRDLLAAHARGENTVVLIEEAQNLDTQVLEQLRLLTNLETSERKLLQIILLGQPELREQLAQPSMSQLSQRITARYHLHPLSEPELHAYVQHRLNVAGCSQNLFSAAALNRLHKLSGGVPRLINVMCDRALLGAYVQHKPRVDVATLETAAQEVLGTQPKTSRWPLILAAVASIAAISILVGVLLPRTPVVPETPPAPVAAAVPARAPATPPAVVMAEPQRPADIVWPDADVALRSQMLAFQSLFTHWQLAYQPEANGSPCFYAETRSLACLRQQGDFETLRAYNRPAILILYDAHGDAHSAALVAMNDIEATLEFAGLKQILPLEKIAQYWRGEFTLIWQQPPGYTDMIKLGHQGEDVLWLRRKLNQLYPDIPPGPSTEYDAAMMEAVRAFQTSEGLLADGIAGVQTLIRLNTVSGAIEPQLMTDSG
jgi:general secretion pathway protein A